MDIRLQKLIGGEFAPHLFSFSKGYVGLVKLGQVGDLYFRFIFWLIYNQFITTIIF